MQKEIKVKKRKKTIFQFQVTEIEKAAFENFAGRHGLSPTEMFRQMVSEMFYRENRKTPLTNYLGDSVVDSETQQYRCLNCGKLIPIDFISDRLCFDCIKNLSF